MRMIVDCENGKFCNVDENTYRVVVFQAAYKMPLAVFYDHHGAEVFRVYMKKSVSECEKYFKEQGFKNINILYDEVPMLILREEEINKFMEPSVQNFFRIKGVNC